MPPRDAAGGAPRLAVIALLPLLVHLSTCGDLDPCRLPRIRSPLSGVSVAAAALPAPPRTCPTIRLPPRAQFFPEDTRVVSPRVFHVTRKLGSIGIGDRVDELELTVLN